MPRRAGPFIVQERVSPVAYRLELPDTYKMFSVVNIQHLTRFIESEPTDFTRPSIPNPRQSDLRAPPEFEVDWIVAWRHNKWKRGTVEYLVRWKDQGPEDDS